MAALNASVSFRHHLLYDRRMTGGVADIQMMRHRGGGRWQLLETRRLHKGLGHCGQHCGDILSKRQIKIKYWKNYFHYIRSSCVFCQLRLNNIGYQNIKEIINK